MLVKRSMWYYRNMPVKMVVPPFHQFDNIDDAAYKLDSSKYLIHQSIIHNKPLYGYVSLVYINTNIKNNTTIPNDNQRTVSRAVAGKKRPRDDSSDKM